eukprot:1041292_1
MVSCSPYSPDGYIDGAYVGIKYESTNITAGTLCTAQNGNNGDGVWAKGICCKYNRDDGYRLDCETKWGPKISRGMSHASCDYGYVTWACSGHSDSQKSLSGCYRDGDCLAESVNDAVQAVATCCRLYKEPTLSPTIIPTLLPTLTSNQPSAIPTHDPTKLPSHSPAETSITTAHPTFVPTKLPSHSPTETRIIHETSTSPTSSPITTEPTNTPVTNSPTDSPTKHPTSQPTDSPIFTGTSTQPPTIQPTNSPTIHPVSPSIKPIITGLPTTHPTASTQHPTDVPNISHTNNPTRMPSVNPSTSPSNVPTSSPITIFPSSNPTISPTTLSPTLSPSSMRLDLFLICKYVDKPITFYTIYITLSRYAEIMVDAVFTSIKSVTYHAIDYEDNESWQYAEWNKAGIRDFKMCKIFNNVQLTDHCVSYDDLLHDSSEDSEDTDGEYTAVATFGIVSDQALDAYQSYISNQLMSNAFRQAFEWNMNQALNDETNANQRRRILLDDTVNFEVVSIRIVDPMDITTTEYDDSNSFGNDNDAGRTTIILIVTLVSIVLLVAAVAILMHYRNAKKRNGEKEEEGKIDKAIQMKELNQLIHNDKMNANKVDAEGGVYPVTGDIVFDHGDVEQQEHNDDDIVAAVNETPGKNMKDEDVINAINKTLGKELDDMRIEENVNRSPNQVLDKMRKSEGPTDNPHIMSDIAKDEKEPGQENSSSSDNFDVMFVDADGEPSI